MYPQCVKVFTLNPKDGMGIKGCPLIKTVDSFRLGMLICTKE